MKEKGHAADHKSLLEDRVPVPGGAKTGDGRSPRPRPGKQLVSLLAIHPSHKLFHFTNNFCCNLNIKWVALGITRMSLHRAQERRSLCITRHYVRALLRSLTKESLRSEFRRKQASQHIQSIDGSNIHTVDAVYSSIAVARLILSLKKR